MKLHVTGVPGEVDYTKIYQIKGTPLKVFFREQRLSNLIMSAVVRSQKTLLEAMCGELKSSRYLLTAMDGETFGHHRPGLDRLLFQIFHTPQFKLLRAQTSSTRSMKLSRSSQYNQRGQAVSETFSETYSFSRGQTQKMPSMRGSGNSSGSC